MIYAYDLDGVLCVKPPDSPKPWRRMKGPERTAWRESLAVYYRDAPRLYEPPQPAFWVITARSEWARGVTMVWLNQHLGRSVLGLFMLEDSRNIENVVAFKTRVLEQERVTDYAEDNRTVVRGLRKTVPACRVWHFTKKGELVLDYPEAPL